MISSMEFCNGVLQCRLTEVSDWGVFTGDGVAVNPRDESWNEEHVHVKGEYISLNRPSARVSDADPVVVPNVPFKHLLSARGLNLGFTTRVLAPVSGSECSVLLQFSSLLCGGCEGNLLIFATVLPDQQQWGNNQLQEVSNGCCDVTDFDVRSQSPWPRHDQFVADEIETNTHRVLFQKPGVQKQLPRENEPGYRSPTAGLDTPCLPFLSPSSGYPVDGSQLPGLAWPSARNASSTNET